MVKGWEGVIERPELANNPSPDALAHPWLFRCPKPNCFYAVSATSEENARKQEREHKCPYTGGITKIAGSITMTLVEDMWARADEAFARMGDDGISPDEFQRRRGVVRGMCEMIAIFSPPHFKTGDEVGRELVKRAASLKEDEPYETPGLGSRIYALPQPKLDPPPIIKEGDQVRDRRTGGIGIVKRVGEPDGIVVEFTDHKGYGVNLTPADLEVLKAGFKAPPKPSEKFLALTDDEKKAIKFAKESGAFTDIQISEVYGITPAEVNKVSTELTP